MTKNTRNKATKEERFKKADKGFTLVELIVVIVILAILAAILVPALLGYIDKAKNQKEFLKAKSCMTATQAILSEYYAKGKELPVTKATGFENSSTHKNIYYIMDDTFIKEVLKTADIGDNECGQIAFGCSGPMTDENGKLSHAGFTIVFYTYATYELPAKYVVFDGTTWYDDDTFNIESKQADYIYILSNN
jgi:prepilin-type N-terminal cleavage/methylation domain-containing protein